MERARSQQLAELSGKVLEYQGADVLSQDVSSPMSPLPPGWAQLLAPGVAMATPCPPVLEHADNSLAVPATPTTADSAKFIPADQTGKESGSLFDFSLDELIQLTTEPADSAPQSYSASKELSGMGSHTTSDADTDIAVEPDMLAELFKDSAEPIEAPPAAKEEDETIWLGMDWLLNDSDEATAVH